MMMKKPKKKSSQKENNKTKAIQYLIFLYCIISIQNIKGQVANPNFFPIGVWLQEPQDAQAYKNAGINLYIGLWNELDQPQLNALRNAGMKVLCAQDSFGLNNLSDTTIYGWTQMDEPDNAQWNTVTQQYDSCINPGIIINYYDSLKINDPSRPVFLNLGQGVSYIDYIGRGYCSGLTNLYPDYNNGYLAGCDIASFDIYPVNNTDTVTSGNLWYVPKGVDSLISWSGNSKPAWCFIETTKISSGSTRQPTTSEVKSEVWMALIHGAMGFGYFCHSFVPPEDDAALLHDSAMLSAVTIINNEITSLAPVLNSPDTSNYATVMSSNPSVPVDIMTKNYGGEDYIFSVAMRSGNTFVTFSMISGNYVSVIGENRNISITAGNFTDSFSTYQVHLYKIISGNTSIIETTKNTGVRIRPNPVTNKSVVELPGNIKGKISFNLYDCMGRLVHENFTFFNGELILNKGNLNSGIYFYSIKDDQKEILYYGKIIIE